MLTDGSRNCDDTWGFLDRRIEDMVSVGKYKNEVCRFTFPCEALSSTDVKITVDGPCIPRDGVSKRSGVSGTNSATYK
jgi:hypothetical protein